jgi:hypothetical protein
VTERPVELPPGGKGLELLKAAILPAEIREFWQLEQSYLTLAENEEWMADNLEKINRPGADENYASGEPDHGAVSVG